MNTTSNNEKCCLVHISVQFKYSLYVYYFVDMNTALIFNYYPLFCGMDTFLINCQV